MNNKNLVILFENCSGSADIGSRPAHGRWYCFVKLNHCEISEWNCGLAVLSWERKAFHVIVLVFPTLL